MKNDCTQSLPVRKQESRRKVVKEKELVPTEKTLSFLKLFARNYKVEEKLPEGLQGVILS